MLHVGTHKIPNLQTLRYRKGLDAAICASLAVQVLHMDSRRSLSYVVRLWLHPERAMHWKADQDAQERQD